MVDLKPTGRYLVTGEFCRGFEYGQLFAAFTDLDLVAYRYLEGRDVYLAAVDFDVAMAHDLASLAARAGEAETEGYVVEAALELLQEQFAGDTLGTGGLLVIGAELALQ